MTPREPDRVETQAEAIVAAFIGREDLGMITDVEPFIAAALRAAESSALERAAQIADRYKSGSAILIADSIRALIPPVAAPAALQDYYVSTGDPDAAPAAETGKAQVGEAPEAIEAHAKALTDEADRRGTSIVIHRCPQGDWIVGFGENMQEVLAQEADFGNALFAATILRKLAAPPEGEGK